MWFFPLFGNTLTYLEILSFAKQVILLVFSMLQILLVRKILVLN
ncbi:hypothetical protein Sps_04744 [Shewanella psychrophila]|uniref:Uncharacterized protein n=1 Tax=Shewanella psychrophila TaxID=225848 RepID=A0A1S6HMC0_9GAMM|nr:hypothetical protein Sps_01510 [Shewanella psychrophila]AQS39827.1 hypothetical protein Sps_04744 [Shewanella psychrophila]